MKTVRQTLKMCREAIGEIDGMMNEKNPDYGSDDWLKHHLKGMRSTYQDVINFILEKW